MRPWHRARQFWQALTAAPPPGAPPELAAGLQALFLRMPPADRAHAWRTYRALAGGESASADLAAAALLHDAGKSGPQIRLWHRILFVLAPARLERLPAGGRWGGLVALRDHAGRGAELAAAAGATPLTIELIRCHHADPAALGWPAEVQSLLQALQRADESS